MFNSEECGVLKDLERLLLEYITYEFGRNSLVSDLNSKETDIGMFHKILSWPNSDDAKACSISYWVYLFY